jgi:two-component system chemotaxis sensor kinase CheA
MPNDPEIIQAYLLESYEGLDQIEKDLIQLEKNPAQPDLVARMFRVLHGVKGTSGLLGFPHLSKMGHCGESLMAEIRANRQVFSKQHAALLLELVDVLRRILYLVETTGGEGDETFNDLHATILALAGSTSGAPSAAPVPSPKAPEPPPPPLPGHLAPTPSTAQAETVHHPTGDHPEKSALEESSLHVQVSLLDELVKLMSELVLVRNQVLSHTDRRMAQGKGDAELQPIVQRLNFLTTELQKNVMQARMQPLSLAWKPYPRLVRNMAEEFSKRIQLEMQGGEIELDRTILRVLRDPLVHLLRNSVDHGIELPAARKAAGKPEEGHIKISAHPEGGLVRIQISDDGQGISLEKLRRHIIATGLAHEDQVAAMTDREVLQHIFLPGFSTAEKVTQYSGRGVGLDAVANEITRIGGSVDVHSALGEGTFFELSVPLTLTIVPALLVTSDNERYAIPRVSVQELVNIRPEEAARWVETVKGRSLLRLRGALLPLSSLRSSLGMEETEPPKDRTRHLVLIQAEGRHYALEVDQVEGFQEIVVKPLGRNLRDLPVYSGTTILGDGRVALILDVAGLARRIRVDGSTSLDAASSTTGSEEGLEKILVFQTPDNGRMAMPLSKVARLEEMTTKNIERVGNLEVVQYHGEVLPLINVTCLLPERRILKRLSEAKALAEGRMHLVVYHHEGRRVGFRVDRLLDILDGRLEVQRPASRKGVLGSMILNGRATELLDVERMIESVVPDFFKGHPNKVSVQTTRSAS